MAIGDRPFIVHYRSIGNEKLGNATVVFVPNPDKTFSVGVSYCSTMDRWNRKFAIKIATGRATKNPLYTIKATTKEQLYEIASDVAVKYTKAPKWIKSLVEYVQAKYKNVK